MSRRSCFSLISLALVTTLPLLAGPGNREAWTLFLNNQPLEAKNIFAANAESKDPKTAGEACRGAGMVARFMGDPALEMKWVLQGFQRDGDTLALMAGQIRHLNYGDSWNAFRNKEVYAVGNELAQHSSLLTSPIAFELARRYLNDGELRKAKKLLSERDILRQWWVIGPFPNISGSGFDKAYSPEAAVELDKTYLGKNGDRVNWFPLECKFPATWIWMKNHIPAANAILYFASQVESPVERKALLSFGASGSFKIFLNDKLVLAERVFRNTGADAFVQEVTLHKGANRILVKLGNEDRYSNFLLRFMEPDGRSITDLAVSKPMGEYPHETGSYPDLKNMPAFDREINYLQSRLQKDSGDVDAALLAMDLYNVHEMTDSGEVWALSRLKAKPQSALWLSLLSETMIRSRQITRGQEFAKAAYRGTPYCALGWNLELGRLSETARPEAVLEFIDKSPEAYRTTSHTGIVAMTKLGQLGRRDEAMKTFAKIETGEDFDEEVAVLEATVYSNQGRQKEAVKTWKKFLEHGQLSLSAYPRLADLYLKSGDWSSAVDVLKEGTGYLPESPNLYLALANVFLHQKKYKDAEKYLAQGLALAPSNSVLLGLQSTLRSLQGDQPGAQKALRKSVESNYNDFSSWDKLLSLEGRPTFESLAPLPNLDSLILASKGWEGLQREHGAILSYIEDVFFYPSRAVRHRGFLAIHLPSQEAVNTWKQYTIPYNSSYQTLGITRAVSHKATGSEIDAEIAGHSLVFKSLEPGDCIVMEWTLKDEYDGEMARQAWGRFDFRLGMPVFDSRLRLLMAGPDTIGYSIRGKQIKREVVDLVGLRIRNFSRSAYTVPVTERFLPREDETNPDVLYSTFPDWGKITDWYSNLTENKTAPAPLLRKVADSLFAGVVSDSEKVFRVHQYVTRNIAYSSLPFRQSGWIPQSAQEVLASRLGDCKDMAALAKSLLAIVGMESHLVLVATRDEFGTRAGPIGPHFNHCILGIPLAGQEHFLDLTDPQLNWTSLPKGDQGAVALVIKRGNTGLIHLPIDDAGNRFIGRTIHTVLNDSGTAAIEARAVRKGIFARGQRSAYRTSSNEERKQDMLRSLSDDYADITLDSLWFGSLEPSTDSVEYGYTFRGPQAVKTSGSTHIFPLYSPDKLSNDDIPDNQSRPMGADLYGAWYSLGTFVTSGTVTFPKQWKLLNRPEPITLKTPYGGYALSFSIKGNVLTYARKVNLELGAVVPGPEVEKVRMFLNQMVKFDDIQLVFSDKGK